MSKGHLSAPLAWVKKKIEELKTRVTKNETDIVELNNNLNKLLIVTSNIANSTYPINTKTTVAIPIEVPEGYAIIGCVKWIIAQPLLKIVSISSDANNIYIEIYNSHTAELSGNIRAYALLGKIEIL